eukprot:8420984-Alexandrium_andersonii.AAC.1
MFPAVSCNSKPFETPTFGTGSLEVSRSSEQFRAVSSSCDQFQAASRSFRQFQAVSSSFERCCSEFRNDVRIKQL